MVWPQQLWVLWAPARGAWLDQGLSCLHSSHRRSRCVTVVVLGPGSRGFVLGALGTQCLWDTRVHCQHSRGWGGTKGSANSGVLCTPAQWVTTVTTEATTGRAQRNTWWSVPVPPTLYCSSEMQLRTRSGGFYSNTQGTDLVPDRAVTTTERRGGPVQYPGQVLGTTPLTPPIKGTTASIHRAKSSRHPHYRQPSNQKNSESHRLQGDAPT